MTVRSHVLDRPAGAPPDAVLTLATGFLATLAITTIMYVLPAVGLPQVDLPIWSALPIQ